MEFKVRNVAEAYSTIVPWILKNGVREQSRNGGVITVQEPVMITYVRPWERTLLDSIRDANPFFHVMEAIWMLAGERASAWPVQFNKQMAAYANRDGEYDGAYGYRWRRHFGFDQIYQVVEQLSSDPTSRRAVIQMYDPRAETADSKDVPCNTAIYFRIVDGKLNMTVTNRSNDAVWGAFGANAVHMSMLQEVIAEMLCVNIGPYTQFTNNLHIYTDIPKVWAAVNNVKPVQSAYTGYKLTTTKYEGTFLDECRKFLDDPMGQSTQFNNSFFYFVAIPMYRAWNEYKQGNMDEALHWANQIEDHAWRLACVEWLGRRVK